MIFEKKSSIFSFRKQKANSLTFCAKISSDCRIWPNRHWDRVEWTQEMVFNTYHHTRTCLDKKIEIDEKKFQKKFSLPISLRATLKRSLRTRFSAKKHFFVFYRNFGFNLEISSYHYSQLKKHLKVDPETRSYDFLTKTHEKNPMSRNILIPSTTLGCHLNTYIIKPTKTIF